MSFRRFATVAALTIAGLLAAVGIGLLANSISGDNVGLSAKPLSAGETLAPSTADRAKARAKQRAAARQRVRKRRAAARRRAQERGRDPDDHHADPHRAAAHHHLRRPRRQQRQRRRQQRQGQQRKRWRQLPLRRLGRRLTAAPGGAL